MCVPCTVICIANIHVESICSTVSLMKRHLRRCFHAPPCPGTSMFMAPVTRLHPDRTKKSSPFVSKVHCTAGLSIQSCFDFTYQVQHMFLPDVAELCTHQFFSSSGLKISAETFQAKQIPVLHSAASSPSVQHRVWIP